MTTRIHKAAALLAIGAALAGCVQTSPQWDSSFGNTVRSAVASQVADPAAARNADPVAGIDGRAALSAQKGYEDSFARPSAPEGSMLSGRTK